jgi:hypothetical protein
MSALAARLKGSAPWVVAFVALLSLGTATAAKLITGKEIANHTITGKDVKKKSLPLSVLTTKPKGQPGAAGAKGAPGAKGATGERGPTGEIGVVGAEGEPGPRAITEIEALNGPIQASIATSAQWGFIGTPAKVLLAFEDTGQSIATVTIGSTEGTIDPTSKFDFQITTCAKVGAQPIEPLVTEEEEEGGEIGVSPTLPQNQRTAVTVSSGFAVFGEPFEGFLEAKIGPCLTNITANKLNENGRVIGDVIVASA